MEFRVINNMFRGNEKGWKIKRKIRPKIILLILQLCYLSITAPTHTFYPYFIPFFRLRSSSLHKMRANQIFRLFHEKWWRMKKKTLLNYVPWAILILDQPLIHSHCKHFSSRWLALYSCSMFFIPIHPYQYTIPNDLLEIFFLFRTDAAHFENEKNKI